MFQCYCDISDTMSCCIVILFLFVMPMVMPLAYEAKEIQAIELTIEKAENEEFKCVKDRRFTFQQNVQTMMYIDAPEQIEKHDCSTSANPHQKLNVTKPVLLEKGRHKANVKNLIETQIKCIFTLQNNKEVQCDFKIALTYWRELKLSINNKQLETPSDTKPNEVAVQYDYFFTPNEIIKVECKAPQDVFGNLQYEFVSFRNYSGLLETVSSMEVQLVLKAEDDKSYFDCKFIGNSETIARVRMVLDTKLEPNFKINGLAIRPLLGRDVSYAYSGVLPNVSCKDSPVEPKKEVLGNWIAGCEDTTLLLNKKIRTNGIEIFGLSDEKITFETCQNMSRECIIYYEYTDKEPIQLVCTSNETKLNWEVGENLKDNRSMATELNVFKRDMAIEDNLSTITCSREHGSRTSIVFQYVDKHAVQGFENTVSTFGGYSFRTTATTNTTSAAEPWTINQMSIYIGMGVLFIVLILLLICILIMCRRRKQLPKSKPIYSNLEGDGQPQQTRRNENIYSNQSTSQTEEYAVPADIQSDANPYSVPYTQKPEDLYAKAIPKNQRPNPHTEEIEYAVVEFKKAKETAERKSQEKSEVLYSEIQSNKDLRKDKNEYVNEFNSRYVNSKQTEYAEPAYCEVGAFNK